MYRTAVAVLTGLALLVPATAQAKVNTDTIRLGGVKLSACADEPIRLTRARFFAGAKANRQGHHYVRPGFGLGSRACSLRAFNAGWFYQAGRRSLYGPTNTLATPGPAYRTVAFNYGFESKR